MHSSSAVIRVAALLFLCALSQHYLPAAQAERAEEDFEIRWIAPDSESASRFVEVRISESATYRSLESMKQTELAELLSVYAEQGNVISDIGMPPMAGKYEIDDARLRFIPQFPLQPGVNYRAVFRPDRWRGDDQSASRIVSSTYRVPAPDLSPSTTVAQVYPSGDVLPENLLKFYLNFSAPMSGGRVYQYIHLLSSNGEEVELPFLELDEELWNPEMTRLTLFIDPGRIKREVRPLEEIGPALVQGERFKLVIDRNWHDARGVPLAKPFEKSFRVGAPDRTPVNPENWIVHAPHRETREPLTVDFDEPMDHALAQRMISVINSQGEPVRGDTTLRDYERQWRFVPYAPWTVGEHKIMVQTTIEDLAGNNIGKAFEMELTEGGAKRLTNEAVSVAFVVW